MPHLVEGIQDGILTRYRDRGPERLFPENIQTKKYKSAPDNVHEVGKQLGVANILEGSVQKIGNAAHINVQLIRVATDEHLGPRKLQS